MPAVHLNLLMYYYVSSCYFLHNDLLICYPRLCLKSEMWKLKLFVVILGKIPYIFAQGFRRVLNAPRMRSA